MNKSSDPTEIYDRGKIEVVPPSSKKREMKSLHEVVRQGCYIATGYRGYHELTEDEQGRELNTGEEVREINMYRLVEAADALFPDGAVGMSAEEYLRLTERFYKTLDLRGRGVPTMLLDSYLLVKYFDQAYREVLSKSPQDVLTGRLLVIGCGRGRLAQLTIELCKKLGLREVVFLDLIEEHVAETRQLIVDTYNVSDNDDVLVVDQLKLRFLFGDFYEISQDLTPSSFDIMTAMWFVTSEILDLSSSDAMRSRRVGFFNRISRLLIRSGVFLEDIPDSQSSGYYRTSRVKTHCILRDRGIMTSGSSGGAPESIHLSLTNIPGKEDQPYHIRYLINNGAHLEEMRAAGLYPLPGGESHDIPGEASLPESPDFVKMFSLTPSICDIAEDLRTLRLRFTHPSSKKKSFHLWTPRSN